MIIKDIKSYLVRILIGQRFLLRDSAWLYAAEVFKV